MIRLNKYMADCGVDSRRNCDKIILEGRVKVNRKPVNELGFMVNEDNDTVTVDGRKIVLKNKNVYIMLHKPKGYVTTVKDEKERKTVMELVDVKLRVYPVGRLDFDTEGLLLLTNDGDMTYKLTHPKYEVTKKYVARNANSVVDYTCKNCRINGITDNTRWGIIGSNFCKNMVVEDCIFSRLDAHMGVSGKYVIRNSQMGHQGLNAIGRGEMIVENTTVYGHNLICFRSDYGSTWEGTVTVKNCTWVPACGRECKPELFGITNSGMHDFGYPCHMPESFTIENLHVDDSNTPADYEGLQLFSDPEEPVAGANIVISDPRPYPYEPSKTVTITGLTCASGKPVHIGPAAKLLKDAVITVNGEKLN